MPREPIISDYFYGDEAEQFSYFSIPATEKPKEEKGKDEKSAEKKQEAKPAAAPAGPAANRQKPAVRARLTTVHA